MKQRTKLGFNLNTPGVFFSGSLKLIMSAPISALMVLLCVTTLVSCSTTNMASQVAPSESFTTQSAEDSEPATTARAPASSTSIDQEILNAFSQLRAITGSNLSRVFVEANRGRVVLSGEVPDESVRQSLLSLVTEIGGVRAVSDRLEIRAPASAPGAPVPVAERSLVKLALDLFKPLLVMIGVGAVLIAVLFIEYFWLRRRLRARSNFAPKSLKQTRA